MSAVTDWSNEQAAANLEKSYASVTSQRQRSWTLDCLPPSPSDNVLDLGCGPGFLLADLASRSASSTGCDPSEAFLALARARCGSDAHICKCDGTTIPFDDEVFDKVYVVQVLLYCEDPLAIIQECRRVLKVGGSLCLVETDWNALVCSAPQALFEEVKKVRVCEDRKTRVGTWSKRRGLARGAIDEGWHEVRSDSALQSDSATVLTTLLRLASLITGLYQNILGPLHGLKADRAAPKDGDTRDQ